MSVAKFVAANGREALRRVREALGPDAVVLSNRVVEGGVEIVAMTDSELGTLSSGAPAYQAPVVVAQQPSMAMTVPGQVPDGLGDLRGELQSMRAMIERQLSGMPAAAQSPADPLRESLFEWLVGAGFSAQLARTLLARLPAGHDRPAAVTWMRREIASKVPVLEDEDALFGQGGVLALVGPTGVGKTTTTAKLAARFVLKHGADKLALLTTDTFRIGAHEQLRIYGDILGVPVHAVKDAADLRFALGALSQKHLVIIDTVGMSQRDRNLSEQIAMLAGAPAPVQRVLLLNGASHGDTLNEVVHAYRHDASPGGGVDGCIISKLDEATHLGSVLDVVIRHRLPVYYASTGQRVPEHLELARGEALVERAFMMPRRGSVFADAEAARRSLAAASNAAADSTAGASQAGGMHDVLRTIADSSHAVGGCVAALRDGPYGFGLLRELWTRRAAPDLALRPLSQQIRDALCQDAIRHSDRYLLAATVTLPCNVPGRRAPQPWQHTVWMADRDGMPVAAAVEPAGRAARGDEWASEMQDWRVALSARRTVVHLLDAVPATGTVHQWQNAGERWLASARKTTRVICDGTAWKVEALAETLTFHALGETQVRERDAMLWVAQTQVRTIESQVRATRASAEGGLDAGLLVARAIDRETGQTLAVDYLLADPALASAGPQIARWARLGEQAAVHCRTVRHALDQLGQSAADGAACAPVAMISMQAGLTALRLAHAPVAEAVECLAGLAGRTTAKDATPGGAALLEGIARLLALLDVLENFPGRQPAAPIAIASPVALAAPATAPATEAAAALASVRIPAEDTAEVAAVAAAVAGTGTSATVSDQRSPAPARTEYASRADEGDDGFGDALDDDAAVVAIGSARIAPAQANRREELPLAARQLAERMGAAGSDTSGPNKPNKPNDTNDMEADARNALAAATMAHRQARAQLAALGD
ncbi:flagellar biosynthesis protein FlhF [Paracidovorax citrulli]